VIDRERMRQEIGRIAFGELELSGRPLASRVTAFRTLEHVTRNDGDGEPPGPGQARLDFPVGPDGRFDPSADPAWWPVNLTWRWTARSAREAEAIERWRGSVERHRWEAAGKPWPRSEWEADPTPWMEALASLRHKSQSPIGRVHAEGDRRAGLWDAAHGAE
jgi:hypothetical protein